jgi:protoporphyrinogen/coproporphyrinogen III oxidase
MSEIKKDVTIIGAGLTGLTLAFYLQRAGKKVLLVEKEDRLGGVIRTVSEQGFVYETGPNTGVLANPEIVELFEDLAGLCELETANPLSKNRWIWKSGQWHPLPGGLSDALKTPLFTRKDKFRILGEIFRKKGNDPFESVADLVKRRLGESYLDYAVDPFISGIYAGDPSQLITRFALPKLYNLEQHYGSFIGGAIKKKFEPKDERSKKVSREVFSVHGGIQNLLNALAEKIGKDNILKDCRQVTVHPLSRGFEVFTGDGSVAVLSEKIITTTGSYTLPSLLPFIPDNSLLPVTRMKYAGVVQVIAGYRNWHGIPLGAFGGLVPGKEKRNVLGILFPSSIFSDRTPANGALLSVFLGGVKHPEMLEKTDPEINTIVMKEINETLQCNQVPDLFRIFRYTHAIPQYERSSLERLACIEALQIQFPGLILGGNIRDGIGMADRVKQAKVICEQIIK